MSLDPEKALKSGRRKHCKATTKAGEHSGCGGIARASRSENDEAILAPLACASIGSRQEVGQRIWKPAAVARGNR
jgi:hypothetical protein